MDDSPGDHSIGWPGDRDPDLPGEQRTGLIKPRPLLTWVFQVGAVVVGVLIVLLTFQIIYGSGSTHADLVARLDVLEQQATFQNCVLSVPSGERSLAVIAECQVSGGK